MHRTEKSRHRVSRPDGIRPGVGALIVLSLFASPDQIHADEARIRLDGQNPRIEVLTLVSTHQSGPNRIFVIHPAPLQSNKDRLKAASRRYLYVLPVEAGEQRGWGNPLQVILNSETVHREQLTCIYPTFSDLPWYCDHPERSDRAQESFLVHAVLPAVERRFPTTAGQPQRLLIGFSKSGWGALSLLLRNPGHFAGAAAWDAPLMMDRPGRYGSGPIFGNQTCFEQHQLSRRITELAPTGPFFDEARIVHGGYGGFQQHHVDFETLLQSRRLPHLFLDGPQRKHHWESGWFEPCLKALLTGTAKESTDSPARN